MYVLPCRDRDLIKVGFARDPLRRFIDLHRRFHAFFDLSRGLLVAVDKVSEARRIERILLTQFADARANPPLEVRAVAGGRTEWYQGIDARVVASASALADASGYTVQAPLSAWLAARLGENADRLYDWARHVYDAVSEAAVYDRPVDKTAQMLALTLEYYDAAGLEVRTLVPVDVWLWYQRGCRF